jgi:hypothetical protein
MHCVDQSAIKDIRTALNVPIELDETYIRVFDRLRSDFPDELHLIKRIFFWLVHSLRPLRASELAEAVVFTVGRKQMDFAAVPTKPEDLIQYCGSLVSLSDPENTIGLAHFSIKEFLLSNRLRTSRVSGLFAGDQSTQWDLANIRTCCLSMGDFSSGHCVTMRQLRLRLDTYKFMKYSFIYWAEHYCKLDEISAKKLGDTVFGFFTDPS